MNFKDAVRHAQIGRYRSRQQIAPFVTLAAVKDEPISANPVVRYFAEIGVEVKVPAGCREDDPKIVERAAKIMHRHVYRDVLKLALDLQDLMFSEGVLDGLMAERIRDIINECAGEQTS